MTIEGVDRFGNEGATINGRLRRWASLSVFDMFRDGGCRLVVVDERSHRRIGGTRGRNGIRWKAVV